MRLEPAVHTRRMRTAAAATAAMLPRSAVPPNREASRFVTAVIIAMLAAREHHCRATFAATYFLLSLTVPISLLLIVMTVTTPSHIANIS